MTIEAKRNRAVYLVESPDGTFSESSPTKIHQQSKKRFHGSKLAMPFGEGFRITSNPSTPSRESSRRLTVREKLQAGIAAGFRKERLAQARLAEMSRFPMRGQVEAAPEALSPDAGLNIVSATQYADFSDMIYPASRRDFKQGRVEAYRELDKVRRHLGRRHPHA